MKSLYNNDFEKKVRMKNVTKTKEDKIKTSNSIKEYEYIKKVHNNKLNNGYNLENKLKQKEKSNHLIGKLSTNEQYNMIIKDIKNEKYSKNNG